MTVTPNRYLYVLGGSSGIPGEQAQLPERLHVMELGPRHQAGAGNMKSPSQQIHLLDKICRCTAVSILIGVRMALPTPAYRVASKHCSTHSHIVLARPKCKSLLGFVPPMES
jgi:hypothetical protein